jgi:IS30 family transposase
MERERQPGPGRGLTDKQDQFSRLIAGGVSNSEACRTVGIHRRTGTRWRYGRSHVNSAGERVHYPPVHTTKPPKPRHPRYLSLVERTLIADLHRQGQAARSIANTLNRSPATISRELRRNADPSGRYLPQTAERLAAQRTERPRSRRLVSDTECREVVNGLLQRRWSPEQVAHELSQRYADQPFRQLCTETIYQAIYDPEVPVARPAKRRRRRRRDRVQGLRRRRRLIDMTMIAERPPEVADRLQAGHWEGDLIMGAGNRSAIGTLIERQTRYLMLVFVPNGRPTAEAVCYGVASALHALPEGLRRTLTWDQGIELAAHRDITDRTGAQVYFCDAHSPWQRASNENINGLLRDYFPKGSDLRGVSAAELARVASEVNDRPRRTLGWARPAELLAAQAAAAD